MIFTQYGKEGYLIMINYVALDKVLESLEAAEAKVSEDTAVASTDSNNTEVVEEMSSDAIELLVHLVLMIAAVITFVVAVAVSGKRRTNFYYENIRNNQELIDLLNRLSKELNKDITSRMGKYGKYVVNTEIDGADIYWNGNSANAHDANNIIYFIAGKFDVKKLFKDTFKKDYEDIVYDTTPATTKKVQEFNAIVGQYNSAVSMENKLITSKTGMDNSIYLGNMDEIYGAVNDYLPYCDPTESEKEVIYVCYMRLMDYTRLSKLPAAVKAKIKAKVDAIGEQASLREAVDLILDGKL